MSRLILQEPKAQIGKPQTKTKEKKKWTVMVYMAGDNNLAEEMVWALKGMFSVGSTKDVQVVALSDSVGALVFYDIAEHKPPKNKKPSVRAVPGKPITEPEAPAVTEDNNLKDKQEKFLTKKDKFAIRSTEEEIGEGLEALVDAQEEVLEDRAKGGDKNLEKAQKVLEKVKDALEERESVVLRTRAGEAKLV